LNYLEEIKKYHSVDRETIKKIVELYKKRIKKIKEKNIVERGIV